jgi:hypothetical protein
MPAGRVAPRFRRSRVRFHEEEGVLADLVGLGYAFLEGEGCDIVGLDEVAACRR